MVTLDQNKTHKLEKSGTFSAFVSKFVSAFKNINYRELRYFVQLKFCTSINMYTIL